MRRRLLFVGSGVSKGAKIDVEKGRVCWGLGLWSGTESGTGESRKVMAAYRSWGLEGRC